MSYWRLLASALVLAGCQEEGSRAVPMDTSGMMEGKDSTTGHMDSNGMGRGNMPMAGMQTHMDSMMRMSPQQMQRMMARHEQMMSRMLDTMGSEMRGMNLSDTPEWNALTDSVKRDLADLPGLKGQELSTRLRAHAERVRRLIAAHEQMMNAMH